MQEASCTVPGDIRATVVRLLAYMGALAILAIAAASLFRAPSSVAAVQPAPQPEWINVGRPHPAFDMQMPELAADGFNYAILRRNADKARKDVLSWGEPAGGGPYVLVEIYRPGTAASASSTRRAKSPRALSVSPSPTTSSRPARSTANSAACRWSISPSPCRELIMDGNVAASASRGRSTIRRCRSPAGIAARTNGRSTAQHSLARSIGLPSCPRAAIPK